MNEKELAFLAEKAMKHAYSPYSNFKVGAALLCKNGQIYTGFNIENSSYSATICAERTAFAKALTEGEASFSALAIVGGKNGEIKSYCPPCGVCRQVMTEFCDKSFKIILMNGEKEIKTVTLDEILPYSFTSDDLK